MLPQELALKALELSLKREHPNSVSELELAKKYYDFLNNPNTYSPKPISD